MCLFSAIMANREYDRAVAVGVRLRALQQALDASNEDMAAWAGCTGSAWWNYANGWRRIPTESAAALKRRWGLTLDWIYLGDGADKNNPELQLKIDAALKNPRPLIRGRRAEVKQRQ